VCSWRAVSVSLLHPLVTRQKGSHGRHAGGPQITAHFARNNLINDASDPLLMSGQADGWHIEHRALIVVMSPVLPVGPVYPLDR
jgi:hypothetical protein